MLRINEIKLTIHEPKEELSSHIIKKLRIKKEDLLSYRIFRESIDARASDMIYFSYCVDVCVKQEERLLKQYKWLSKAPDLSYQYPVSRGKKLKYRPVVIGFGPSGMFAALLLAQMGYQPVVYERGSSVEQRVKQVEAFWKYGALDPNSNVQFGEGGAGTFSDGKLTTRVKDLRARKVLKELHACGADEDILYQAHPHIGTDILRRVVKNVREKIIALGGTIHFDAPVTDIRMQGNRIKEIMVHQEWIPCDQVILCIGHSARDTFFKLHERQVSMCAKAFAVGARIEHLQRFINEKQYRQFAGHARLSAAEYRFVHTCKNGRGVYTFCMCPGGTVVPSASEEGGVVVNGMSEHARDTENANSALLVQVTPDDFGSHPLAGVDYQRQLEQNAFLLGKGNYAAPAQNVEDFLNGALHELHKSPSCSYALGTVPCDLNKLFDTEIAESLKEGILAFDRKMPGFAKHAVLTGVETRSSSPVRIIRDPATLLSENIANLYPCGEGAGYAGGIVSAAIDGLKCAERLIETYAPAS